MKTYAILILSVAAIAYAGCANQGYNTVKTSNDRYLLTGPDPNRLQGNAYEACKKDGFPEYTVVSEEKGTLNVRCEKEKKSFSATVGETWDSVKTWGKKQVKDFSEPE